MRLGHQRTRPLTCASGYLFLKGTALMGGYLSRKHAPPEVLLEIDGCGPW
jgi:hypothetical protein